MIISRFLLVTFIFFLLHGIVVGANTPGLPSDRNENSEVLDFSPDATWYASTTGDDYSGDGTPGNPFRHIQHTVDIASNADVIMVEPGTYEENVYINSKRLSIISTDPNQYASLYSDTSRCLLAIHSDYLYLYGW